MNITVEQTHKTTKSVWEFYLSDRHSAKLTILLHKYSFAKKEDGQRKYRVVQVWDYLDKRNSNLPYSGVVIPDWVKEDVVRQINESIVFEERE